MSAEVIKNVFEQGLPSLFHALVKQYPVRDMEGTVFKMQVELQGEGGAVYTITITDAREIKVSQGTQEDPMLAIEVPEPAWRKALAGGLDPGRMPEGLDPGKLMPTRELYEAMKDIAGTITFSVQAEGEPPMPIRLILNGGEGPSATMSAPPEIFMQFLGGDPSQLPHAFMSGKLKIDGNMPFLMRLAGIMAQTLA